MYAILTSLPLLHVLKAAKLRSIDEPLVYVTDMQCLRLVEFGHLAHGW
jgi:hypothetical protein